MTLQKIIMPQLGESVTEGTLSKWLVSPGDYVAKYESIAEVITDKVSAELPTLYSGIIKELIVAEGDTLAVNEVICTIEPTEHEEKQLTDNLAVLSSVTDEQYQREKTAETRQRYSPAVLKLSKQHNIDLSKITGTGLGGRITRKDVQAQITATKTDPSISNKIENEKTSSTKNSFQTKDDEIEIELSPIRKTIAENIVNSKREIPHAWVMIEVDVTELVNFRNKIKAEFAHREGYKLTYFPFFVKAVAQALRKYPQLNSMWAGDKIIQKRAINTSIAIATESALYTPVIKNSDEKSIKGIAKEIDCLVKKVHNNSLTIEDIEGGTFTVNNTGTFGSIKSMGVINYPQAAILQVESIVKRPVVINNMIAVRDIVNLCLSIDHRILDGLIAGQFLQHVKKILESINERNTSIY